MWSIKRARAERGMQISLQHAIERRLAVRCGQCAVRGEKRWAEGHAVEQTQGVAAFVSSFALAL